MKYTSIQGQNKPLSLEAHKAFTLPDATVGKKDGFALIPALFRPCIAGKCKGTGVKCSGGPHRLGVNVTHMTGIGFDFDHLSESAYSSLLEYVAGLGLACWIWETFSHKPPDDCRLRVVFPFAEEMPLEDPSQWTLHAWPRLVTHFAFPVQADISCRDPAHIFFLPRMPEGASRDTVTLEGALLDWRKVVGVLPSASTPAPPVSVPKTGEVDLAAARAYLDGVATANRVYVQRLIAGKVVHPPASDRSPDAPPRREIWRALSLVLARSVPDSAPTEALTSLWEPSYLSEVATYGQEAFERGRIESLLASARDIVAGERATATARLDKFREVMARVSGASRAPSSTPASAPCTDEEEWPFKFPEGAVDDAIALMNSRYALICDTDLYVGELVRNSLGHLEPLRFKVSALKTLHAARHVIVNDRKVNLVDAWIASPARRTYRGITVEANGASPDLWNLWQGFTTAKDPTSWNGLREVMEKGLCAGDAASFDYLLQWCAWCVQNPTEVAAVATVLKGAEGIGKGVFGNTMVALFGSHGQRIDQPHLLTGHFNAHRALTCFLFADEAFFAGDPSADGALKGAITESTFMLEAKGFNATMMKNRLKVLMATNSDWAVRASADARRYFVLECAPHKQGDHGFWKDVVAELDNGGREAFLNDLLQLDLSSFNVRNRPVTAGLREEQINSADSLETWIAHVREAGQVGETVIDAEEGTWIPLNTLWEAFLQWRRDTGCRDRCPKLKAAGRVLSKAFGDRVQRHHMRVRKWGYVVK